MDELEDAGTFIGHVLASLVERVTALEQGRQPRIRPVVDDEPELMPGITKAHIDAEMIRLFRVEQLGCRAIGKLMGYTERTVRNHLKRAGVYAAPAKKETV